MDSSKKLKILTVNAHRIGRIRKLLELKEIIINENANIIHIQEIVIASALKVFSDAYQILVNYEERAAHTDGVGMVSLIENELKVIDFIIGSEGRTIGIKLHEIQSWHVYPKSGSENKKWREKYFRETLPNQMINWKDHTSFVSQAGDHNCTTRLEDSLNNSAQHLQKDLVKHFQVFGLKDEYVRLHGKDRPVSFSRITNRSKTRIDFIASNSAKCIEFKYKELGDGFDHKMGVAIYDIDMEIDRENVPKEKKYQNWVFPKELCDDEEFNEKAKEICDSLEEEIFHRLDTNHNLDYTKYWVKLKKRLVTAAKAREKEIKFLENGRKNALNGFLELAIERIENGEDAWDDFKRLRKELSDLWQVKVQRKINKLKCIEIEDHMYDIHKIQRQKKYENKGKIKELSIDGQDYTGTKEVLEGLHAKLSKDLDRGSMPLNEPATSEEQFFLHLLPKLELTRAEEQQIVGEVTEEECEEIFKKQVNLDSSPAIDGITYRIMWHLYRNIPFYKDLLIKMINWIRINKDIGHLEDLAVMKLLNKRRQTTKYEGKRKLTLNNKDVSLVGKVWTNRFTRLILTKVLPKSQFICQEDINIVDENVEIRNAVAHLRGDIDGIEKDGTVVAIDYQDAFRSTYHRWFMLVMTQLGVPESFSNWFWAMYKKLKLIVTLNGQKSEKIKILRGMMEGHAASMPAFAISVTPILLAIENIIDGITSSNGKVHKVKAFADDSKIFLNNPEKINDVFALIQKFEQVSGLKMHRDPTREKCKALTFGTHRNYNQWPTWVTLATIVKILGILYSNDKLQTLEKLNSDMVKENVLVQLHGAYGMRGTVMQKVHFANSIVMSKIWYTAQSIQLEEKMLKEIDKKIRDFIHAGENERPVQAVVYRPKEVGGLGLICPLTKARAFTVKSMYKEWKMSETEQERYPLYGKISDLETILMDEEENCKSVQQIYKCLLEDKIKRGNSLIPTRAEKRNPGIKYKVVWENQSLIKRVRPEEKYFAWCLGQDMVPVGARLHRANQRKECQQMIEDEETGEQEICGAIETLQHALANCNSSREKFNYVKTVLEKHMEKQLTNEQVLSLALNHRNKKKLQTLLWFALKSLHFIWLHREKSIEAYWLHMKNEMFFHQLLERWRMGDGGLFANILQEVTVALELHI